MSTSAGTGAEVANQQITVLQAKGEMKMDAVEYLKTEQSKETCEKIVHDPVELVKELADKIGIHQLCAIAMDIRGMDAVVVLKTIASMCRSYERCSDGCPLYGICICSTRYEANPELIVAAVEEWRKEHPAKTRQSEFLKIIPNTYIDTDGNIGVSPCAVDKKFREEKCGDYGCVECARKYWTEEIE